MIGKILVPLPVESAKSGAEALAMAADIAKSNDSKIVLLHVIEIVPGYVSAHLPADFHKKALETSEADLKAAAGKFNLGDKCDIVVREGNPAAEILDFANQNGDGHYCPEHRTFPWWHPLLVSWCVAWVRAPPSSILLGAPGRYRSCPHD